MNAAIRPRCLISSAALAGLVLMFVAVGWARVAAAQAMMSRHDLPVMLDDAETLGFPVH